MKATRKALYLSLLTEHMSVCRLDPSAEIPDWATTGGLFSITLTAGELSVVCSEASVLEGIRHEGGWRVLKLEGPSEFSEVGVLASVSGPLDEAGVGVFALSTFDADYVLVKEEQSGSAVAALRGRGHKVLPTFTSLKEGTC